MDNCGTIVLPVNISIETVIVRKEFIDPLLRLIFPAYLLMFYLFEIFFVFSSNSNENYDRILKYDTSNTHIEHLVHLAGRQVE